MQIIHFPKDLVFQGKSTKWLWQFHSQEEGEEKEYLFSENNLQKQGTQRKHEVLFPKKK